MRTGFTNRPGSEYDEDLLDTLFAEDMQAIADFINADEHEFPGFIAASRLKTNSTIDFRTYNFGDPATDTLISTEYGDDGFWFYVNDSPAILHNLAYGVAGSDAVTLAQVEELIAGGGGEALLLDTSNGPLTGDLEIFKVIPRFFLTTEDDGLSSWFERIVDTGEITLHNEDSVPASPYYSVSFSSGSHEYLAFNYTASAINAVGGVYTLAIWMKTSGGGPTYQNIISKGEHMSIGMKNHELYSYDWNTNTMNLTGVMLNDNVKHLIVVRINSGVTNGSTISVDGEVVYTMTYVVKSSTSNDFCIGSAYSNGSEASQDYNGIVDEYALFNRLISSGEEDTMWNDGVGLRGDSGIAPWNSGLVHALHMDEGSGSTAYDWGPNGYNGTLTNTPTWIDPGLVPTEVSIDDHVVFRYDYASKFRVDSDIRPLTNNAYYLGKNSVSSPLAWKGLIVKDTTNGNYYRIEVISGTITASLIT